MKLFALFAFLVIFLTPALAQKDYVPRNIADSVGGALHWTEDQFYSVAEAMPDSKYDFVPTAGNFKDIRSFAEQVKHVACSNFAFFNEIEGKTPPEHCEKGGPAPAKTKAELLKYLKDSFDYGNKSCRPSTPRMSWTASKVPMQGRISGLAWRWLPFGTSLTTTARSWNTCA